MTPFNLRQIVRSIRQGGIVAYPTEGVYGLGCDPLNADSVFRLLAIKNRSQSKGLILLASHLEQLRPYLATLNEQQQQKLSESWPGASTWVIPANPATPRWITGQHRGIAVRVTAHPVAKAICERLQHPIISTSANITGHPAARNSLRVRQYFPVGIDYCVSGSNSLRNTPTPITDLVSGQSLRA